MCIETEAFDVIVVGAGAGGTIAARFAAQNGLQVCLVERKSATLEPAKICGDAIGSEVFDLLDIAHPRGEEVSCHIKGVKLYSPDRDTHFTIIDPKISGYVVDRLRFGQRLLKEALDAGVRLFLDQTKALDLLREEGKVAGISVLGKDGQTRRLRSKLVIDASGINSLLRKSMNGPLVESSINKEDQILCYREIVSFPTRAQQVDNPDYISIFLDKDRAPGGYVWYFPKNNHALNIGMGAFMSYGQKVKDLYKTHVFDFFIKTGKYEILSSGGGVVPVRRPLWSCVDQGIMFCGDAAMHVNPLHGGGIDPAMRAGYYAAMTAVNATREKDYSTKTLWEYNLKIMRGFGSEFAGLDLLRRVLQNLNNEDLNFGMHAGLLSGHEILSIAKEGKIELTPMQLTQKAIRGISRPRFLLKLFTLCRSMNKVAALYQAFPGTDDRKKFESWKGKVVNHYKKIDRLIPAGTDRKP